MEGTKSSSVATPTKEDSRDDAGVGAEEKDESPKRCDSAEDVAWQVTTPQLQGWLKKKGAIHTEWRRRYVLLCNVPGCGWMLFYYGSKELAHRMLEFGDATYKGIITMSRVKELSSVQFPGTLLNTIQLHTEDRTWELLPSTMDEYALWYKHLKASVGTDAQNGDTVVVAAGPSPNRGKSVAV